MKLSEMIYKLNAIVLAVDKADKIVGYNDFAKSKLGEQLNKDSCIKAIFEKWNLDQSTGLISAKLEDKSFVFIQFYTTDLQHTFYVSLPIYGLQKLFEEKETLKTLNKNLSAVIDVSYDGIYITDKHGKTLKTNSAIERITGIPKEYYIGKNVDELIDRGILRGSVTHLVQKNKRTASLVQENYEGKPTLLTGVPLFDENGNVEQVITNIRDLSDLKDLETELTKARKLNEEYRKKLSLLKEQAHFKQGAVVQSEEMLKIYETAERIANIDATVLITGETGVGKDVLANYIFSKSTRSTDGEFIKVNCGAIPEELLESELFGYEAGAFTGANPKGKIGLFEAAHNGVLFLDEVGELPLNLQVKLLRVIQEREIQKIGGIQFKKVNVRIIAASNQNLKDMVDKGTFREDLYYCINVIPLRLSPLRERRADILPLMNVVLEEVNERYGMNKTFSESLKKFFYSYKWSGNVRELSNLVERLVVTTPNNLVDMEDLPLEYSISEKIGQDDTVSIPPLKDVVESAERKVFSLAAEKAGSTYEIAKLLGISQTTAVRRMQKYGIECSEK